MRNFLTEMLYALTSAYTRTDYEQPEAPETNIGKLFSIFAWGLETVQDQSDLILLWDDIDNARGRVLDRYGANFGVKRNGMNDTFYRLSIKVKVLSQLSGGDTDTVIQAAASLLDVDIPAVELEDVFPAKIDLYVDWLLLSRERQEFIEPIAWAIKRILAAGVGMRLYVRTYRTYRYDLGIHHAGCVETQLTAPPIGRDRESVEEIPIKFGGYEQTGFAPLPVGEDRSSSFPVQAKFGAFIGPGFTPAPVASERAYTARQETASGVIYRTHIRAKRID